MIKYLKNKDITNLNTFRMKVKSEMVVECSEPEDLFSLDWDSLPQPVLPVGEGSNILFTKNFPGTILRLTFTDKNILPERCEGDDVFVRAGAGLAMDDFCKWCAAQPWWGPENLSGIPGTVGASAVQNVGAYGVEAGDIIDSVECFDILNRCFVTIGGEDCNFAYRDSFFKHHRGRYIVVAVIFHLYRDFRPCLTYGHLAQEVERNAEILPTPSDPYKIVYDAMSSGPKGLITPMLVRDTVRIIREGKLPDVKKIGSAGSFFKNPVVTEEHLHKVEEVVRSRRGEGAEVPHYNLPDGSVKIPAAFLIDFCGLKGAVRGGAAVWDNQPLVIVNASGNALPEDILLLENHIVSTVESTFDISLSPEVDHI